MRDASTVIAFAVGISTPLCALAATGEGRDAPSSEVSAAAGPDGGEESVETGPDEGGPGEGGPDEGGPGEGEAPEGAEAGPGEGAEAGPGEGAEAGPGEGAEAGPGEAEGPELDGGPGEGPTMPPPPTRVEVDPRHYRMVLAGDILIGLGGAGLVAMGVGLGIRSDAVAQREGLNYVMDPDPAQIERQDQRIATGTLVAIVGGASAGVLMVSGITLVALGYRFERQRRASLPAVSLAPTGASLSWSLRF